MKKELKKFINYVKKHLKALNKSILYVKHDSCKLYVEIFFDIIWCYIRYGIDYDEYRIFEFYNIKSEKRKTYISSTYHDDLIKKINKYSKISNLKSRRKFYDIISKYLNRKVYFIKDLSFKEFELLALDKKKFFCRSLDNFNEEKTKIYDVKDFRSPAFLLDRIDKENLEAIEVYISHNKELNKFDSDSILNIVTLSNKNKTSVVSSSIIFKNIGLTGFIDIKTGCIKGKLRDSKGISYDVIPSSKEKFHNFKIPNFEEACNLVTEVAPLFDDICEIEWKLYISNTKVYIIAANLWEDYDFAQIPEYLKNRIGLLSIYKKILKNRD